MKGKWEFQYVTSGNVPTNDSETPYIDFDIEIYKNEISFFCKEEESNFKLKSLRSWDNFGNTEGSWKGMYTYGAKTTYYLEFKHIDQETISINKIPYEISEVTGSIKYLDGNIFKRVQ
jgi:hypothetical protein